MIDQTRPRTRGRQPEATRQQTRRRIVECARAIFSARGFEGVSLRDIATEAGVTHGLLRYHFGSKDAIWRAVIDDTLEEFLDHLVPLINQAAAQDVAAHVTLQTTIRLLIRVTARYPDVTRLLIHESIAGGSRLEYFLERITPIQTLMAPHFRTTQAEGWLRQFTHETFMLTMLTMGSLPLGLEAFSNRLCGINILAEDEVERHADRVLTTLFPHVDGAGLGQVTPT